MPAPRRPTTNVKAVQSLLDDIVLTPKLMPLATLAVTLAKRLDEGMGSMALAPVAKELRATLAALAPALEDHDDLLDALRAPVGDGEN